MPNNKAIAEANAAAQHARQARLMMLSAGGAVSTSDEVSPGAGGFGLQYLADAIEHTALAIAYLAQM